MFETASAQGSHLIGGVWVDAPDCTHRLCRFYHRWRDYTNIWGEDYARHIQSETDWYFDAYKRVFSNTPHYDYRMPPDAL